MNRLFLLAIHLVLGVLSTDCTTSTYFLMSEVLLGYPSSQPPITVVLLKGRTDKITVSGPPGFVATPNTKEKYLNITAVGGPTSGSGCQARGAPRLLEYFAVVGLALLLLGTKKPGWYVVGAVLVLACSLTLPTTDAECAGTTVTITGKDGVYVRNGSPMPAAAMCGAEPAVKVREEKEGMYTFVQYGCQWRGVYKKVYTDPVNKECDSKGPASVSILVVGDTYSIGQNAPQIRETWMSGTMKHLVPQSFQQQWFQGVSGEGGANFSHVGMLVDSNGKTSKLVPVVAILDSGQVCKFTYQCESGDCLAATSTNCGMINKEGDQCAGRVNGTKHETVPNSNCGMLCESFQCSAVCVDDDCSAPKSCSDASVATNTACTSYNLKYCGCEQSTRYPCIPENTSAAMPNMRSGSAVAILSGASAVALKLLL